MDTEVTLTDVVDLREERSDTSTGTAALASDTSPSEEELDLDRIERQDDVVDLESAELVDSLQGMYYCG